LVGYVNVSIEAATDLEPLINQASTNSESPCAKSLPGETVFLPMQGSLKMTLKQAFTEAFKQAHLQALKQAHKPTLSNSVQSQYSSKDCRQWRQVDIHLGLLAVCSSRGRHIRLYQVTIDDYRLHIMQGSTESFLCSAGAYIVQSIVDFHFCWCTMTLHTCNIFDSNNCPNSDNYSNCDNLHTLDNHSNSDNHETDNWQLTQTLAATLSMQQNLNCNEKDLPYAV